MTLVRQWVGRRDKPPIVARLDRSLVDPKWGWVYESLVAAWIFNEPGGDAVRDVLGRMNGTLVAGTGSKPIWQRDGLLWGIVPIDSGASSGVDLSGDGSVLGDNFTPNQISIETWSRWTVDNGNDPRLLAKQSSSAGADHYFMVGSIDSGGNIGRPRFRLKAGGTTLTHIAVTDNLIPLAGDLVQMVWTYDGALVRLYLNAVEELLGSPFGVQSGTVDGGTGVPLQIGNGAWSGAANEFAAPIYKVAIYDRALTPAQVTALCYDPYGAFRPVRRTMVFWPHLELGPISLMDSQQHDFLRDELDDPFTVGSTVDLDVHDDQWQDVMSPVASANYEVVASNDKVEFDAPSGGGFHAMRFVGGLGDEIEVDLTLGDQAAGLEVGVLIRDQDGAVDSENHYRLFYFTGSGDIELERYNAGSLTQVDSSEHTFAKDTTQRWRVWCKTMADRVRIFVVADGVLHTFDDTSGARFPVVGFCGFHAFNLNSNGTGTRTGFDNLVIRSTPLVYDEVADGPSSDVELDSTDDYVQWRGFSTGVEALRIVAANDRIELLTAVTTQVQNAVYWVAPSGTHPMGLEADVHTHVASGAGGFDLDIRHDGGTSSTARAFRLELVRGGTSEIREVDRAGGSSLILDLTAASPAFTNADDTDYHVVFWAETIGSDVRLHLVIDDNYWTVLVVAPHANLRVDGRPGIAMSSTVVANEMWIQNLRFYDSPPAALLADALDTTFARSPSTGAEQFDVKLAQPGGTPKDGTHTLTVRAKEV